MKLDELISYGFEASTKNGKALRVRCYSCEALVINGIPTHEHGCPEAKHECHGCNELISMTQRYCQDCR